jgi:hypothetical protein
VGLRWWNEVNAQSGDGNWVFESADPEARQINATDKRFFWLALYSQPVSWVALGIVAIFRLHFIWLSLVGKLLFAVRLREMGADVEGEQLLRLCLLLRIHLLSLAATSLARLRILLLARFLLVGWRVISVVLCWAVSSDEDKSWVIYFSFFPLLVASSVCCLHTPLFACYQSAGKSMQKLASMFIALSCCLRVLVLLYLVLLPFLCDIPSLLSYISLISPPHMCVFAATRPW